jgi:hypothetical protein
LVATQPGVQLLGAGLDACRHAPLAAPGFGAIAGFGVAAHDIRLGFSAAHPDIVGGDLDQTAQHGVARQTEDKVHVIGLAPRHQLGTAIGIHPVTAALPTRAGGLI